MDKSIKQFSEVAYPTGQGTLVVSRPDINGVVIVADESGEYRRVSIDNVKPIPTERDKLVARAFDILDQWPETTNQDKADALIDAGWRPIKQQTEEEFRDKLIRCFSDGIAIYEAGCRFIERGE